MCSRPLGAGLTETQGACGGSCACSTCHVIVQDEDLFDKIPEADDDENGQCFQSAPIRHADAGADMLDLAFGLTETSRLGCQVKMTKDLDGLVVKLPSMTRNMQAAVNNSPSASDSVLMLLQDFEKKS